MMALRTCYLAGAALLTLLLPGSECASTGGAMGEGSYEERHWGMKEEKLCACTATQLLGCLKNPKRLETEPQM